MWRRAQTHCSFSTPLPSDPPRRAAKVKGVFSQIQRQAFRNFVFPIDSMKCAENGTADPRTPDISQVKKGAHPEDWVTFKSLRKSVEEPGPSASTTTSSTVIPRGTGGGRADVVTKEGSSGSSSGTLQPPQTGGIRADDDTPASSLIIKDASFQRENPKSLVLCLCCDILHRVILMLPMHSYCDASDAFDFAVQRAVI